MPAAPTPAPSLVIKVPKLDVLGPPVPESRVFERWPSHPPATSPRRRRGDARGKNARASGRGRADATSTAKAVDSGAAKGRGEAERPTLNDVLPPRPEHSIPGSYLAVSSTDVGAAAPEPADEKAAVGERENTGHVAGDGLSSEAPGGAADGAVTVGVRGDGAEGREASQGRVHDIGAKDSEGRADALADPAIAAATPAHDGEDTAGAAVADPAAAPPSPSLVAMARASDRRLTMPRATQPRLLVDGGGDSTEDRSATKRGSASTWEALQGSARQVAGAGVASRERRPWGVGPKKERPRQHAPSGRVPGRGDGRTQWVGVGLPSVPIPDLGSVSDGEGSPRATSPSVVVPGSLPAFAASDGMGPGGGWYSGRRDGVGAGRGAPGEARADAGWPPAKVPGVRTSALDAADGGLPGTGPVAKVRPPFLAGAPWVNASKRMSRSARSLDSALSAARAQWGQGAEDAPEEGPVRPGDSHLASGPRNEGAEAKRAVGSSVLGEGDSIALAREVHPLERTRKPPPAVSPPRRRGHGPRTRGAAAGSQEPETSGAAAGDGRGPLPGPAAAQDGDGGGPDRAGRPPSASAVPHSARESVREELSFSAMHAGAGGRGGAHSSRSSRSAAGGASPDHAGAASDRDGGAVTAGVDAVDELAVAGADGLRAGQGQDARDAGGLGSRLSSRGAALKSSLEDPDEHLRRVRNIFSPGADAGLHVRAPQRLHGSAEEAEAVPSVSMPAFRCWTCWLRVGPRWKALTRAASVCRAKYQVSQSLVLLAGVRADCRPRRSVSPAWGARAAAGRGGVARRTRETARCV